MPTLPGTSSWAYTRMAENADARMKPITTLSTPVQARPTYGSARVNGSTPRIEHQMTSFRPNRSPTGPPMIVPAATAPRKANRWSCALCTLDAEPVDQVERVVARDAGQVDVLGEDQHDEHAEGEPHLGRRQRRVRLRGGRAGRGRAARGAAGTTRPRARAPRWRAAPRRENQATLPWPARQHDERGHAAGRSPSRCSRPPGTATARSRAGRPTPSAPRASDSGWNTAEPRPDEPGRHEQAADRCASPTSSSRPTKREPHARHQRVRLGMMVGIQPDDRLQQRRGELEREGDQADLAEVQMEARLEHGIHGRQQRLHHVVEQVAEADGEQDGKRGRHARKSSAGWVDG